MKRSIIAVIDLGTTGVRTMLVDTNGNICGSGCSETNLAFTSVGFATQSIEEYWQGVVHTFVEAKEKAEAQPDEIHVIGFSQQRCTFGLADRQGLPISDLIAWMDRRGLPFLPRVTNLIGRENYYRTTGLPIYYISSLSKLLWFKENAETLYDSTHRIWPIANFILKRMGVEDPPLDHATASFYGFMDVFSRSWSTNLIDELGLSKDKFPSLMQPGSIVGKLTDRGIADQLGIYVGIPLVVSGGDQQCAALGNGMIHQGQSVLNIGTGTAIMAATDVPIQDVNCVIPCVCHAIPNQYEMEGHAQAAGIILKQFRDEFAGNEVMTSQHLKNDVYDYLMAEASLSSPTSSRLLFIPTLNGSTAPVDYPLASGSILGLRSYHSRADVIHAILEGICLENRWILNSIAANGLPIETVYISGGATKSKFWNQLHADVIGRPMIKRTSNFATSLGAGISAGVAVGLFRDIESGVTSLVKSTESYQPNPKLVDIYNSLYKIFINIYSVLRETKLNEDLSSIPVSIETDPTFTS